MVDDHMILVNGLISRTHNWDYVVDHHFSRAATSPVVIDHVPVCFGPLVAQFSRRPMGRIVFDRAAGSPLGEYQALQVPQHFSYDSKHVSHTAVARRGQVRLALQLRS